MKPKRTIQKGLAAFLATVMLLSSVGTAVFAAEGEGTPSSSASSIAEQNPQGDFNAAPQEDGAAGNAPVQQAASFLPLAETVGQQTVSAGTDSEHIILPEQIEAKDAEENVFTIPVTWISTPEFNGAAAGEYIFSPVLPDGYSVADGVQLPSVRVTVEDVDAADAPKQAAFFVPLEEAVAEQEVTVGTALEALALPAQLEAADTEGTIFTIPVTWASEPEFDGAAVSEYVFSPVLPDGYTAAEDAVLPSIKVMVRESAALYADGTYLVNQQNFKTVIEEIKLYSGTEITLVLSEDITTSFAGIEGKHVTLQSDGDARYSISLESELVGDLTVDNVKVLAGTLYCGGHRTIFTENSEFTITGTLYGGGKGKTVDSTYVKINGTGKINTTDMENVVVGGSYKGSVDGDIYIELAGNITYGNDQGGHYLIGTNKATAYGGDKYTGDPLYVGGNVTLILDSPATGTMPQNVVGAYNSHVKGDVTVQVKAGYCTGIEGMRESPTQSIVDGNIHIIAGDPVYEGTDRICRIGGNWDIIGAGEKINLTGSLFQVGGNVTVDTYGNVWGWDQDETPESDPPGIVGAESAEVGGDVTINVHGSHMEDIIGVDDSATTGSIVHGNIVINATDVDLRNSYNDQSGIIPVYATAGKDVTVNLDGGSLSGIYGYGGTVKGNMEINITGEPVFTDDEAGVWGVNNTESQDKSVLTFDTAKTSIPIVGYFTEMNVTNHSDVTLGNEKKNAFNIYDVNINTGAKLTTNKQAFSKGALTMDHGEWTANGRLYITETTNTQDSELVMNDYAAFGYGYKDDAVYDKTVVTSQRDTYTFNQNSYTDKIYGNVDVTGSTWKVFVPTVIGGDYVGKAYNETTNKILLPAFVGDENYPDEYIPLEILGTATGSTAVTLVDRTEPTKEGMPIVGQNYINALKASEYVFELANENAKSSGLFFKKIADADTADKAGYDMWQVAKKDSCRVLYEFVSGTADKGLPIEITDQLPTDRGKYFMGDTVQAMMPDDTQIEEADGVWTFEGYFDQNGDKITSQVVSEDNLVEEFGQKYIKFSGIWVFTKFARDVEITKQWDDSNDQDGIRPEQITVELLADGQPTGKTLILNEANGWTGKFENLDQYKNGQKIEYTVSEEKAAGYNEPVVTGDMENGFIITNTHIPETLTVSGSKTWEDSNNQDGKRPASITIRLYANGAETASRTVTEADGWSWEFKDMPKFEDGAEIVYTITEDAVKDYTSQISGYDVTNRYTPGKVNVAVTKNWQDKNNQDGIRPDQITIELYADGKATGKRLALNDGNKWTGAFTDLDEYAAGQKIVYTVAEVKVTGYETTITGDAATGFVVINTHTPTQVTPPETSDPEAPTPPPAPPTPPADSSTPQTGDNSPISLFALLLLIGSVGLAATILYMRKSTNK